MLFLLILASIAYLVATQTQGSQYETWLKNQKDKEPTQPPATEAHH